MLPLIVITQDHLKCPLKCGEIAEFKKKKSRKHQKVVKATSSNLRHHSIIVSRNKQKSGKMIYCGKSLCKADVVCVVSPKFLYFMDLIWGFLKVGHTCVLSTTLPPKQSNFELITNIINFPFHIILNVFCVWSQIELESESEHIRVEKGLLIPFILSSICR